MNPLSTWCQIPPVFIVGCYRTGTSLMRLLLSAHPQLHVSSETNYIDRIGTRLSHYGDLADLAALGRLHRDVTRYLRGERWAALPSQEDLEAWVETCGSHYGSLVTFYGTWEARHAGRTGVIRWGDNTPRYVHCVSFLRQLFPEARFIHMVRDPRDVVASARRLPLGARTPLGIAQDWERAVLSGLLAEVAWGARVVKRIPYESLASGPEEILREVCAFLDVEYTAHMLDFHETRPARHLSTLSHHTRVVQPVSPGSVGRYARDLSPAEVRDVEGYLASAMGILGYLDPDGLASALGRRLGGRTRHLALLARESLRQLAWAVKQEVGAALRKGRS